MIACMKENLIALIKLFVNLCPLIVQSKHLLNQSHLYFQ